MRVRGRGAAWRRAGRRRGGAATRRHEFPESARSTWRRNAFSLGREQSHKTPTAGRVTQGHAQQLRGQSALPGPGAWRPAPPARPRLPPSQLAAPERRAERLLTLTQQRGGGARDRFSSHHGRGTVELVELVQPSEPRFRERSAAGPCAPPRHPCSDFTRRLVLGSAGLQHGQTYLQHTDTHSMSAGR